LVVVVVVVVVIMGNLVVLECRQPTDDWSIFIVFPRLSALWWWCLLLMVVVRVVSLLVLECQLIDANVVVLIGDTRPMHAMAIAVAG